MCSQCELRIHIRTLNFIGFTYFVVVCLLLWMLWIVACVCDKNAPLTEWHSEKKTCMIHTAGRKITKCKTVPPSVRNENERQRKECQHFRIDTVYSVMCHRNFLVKMFDF